MPAANGDAVKEDDAHGVFKHGKRERAEKKHRREQQAAQRVAMGEERPQLLHQSTGLTRDDEFQILAQRRQQACFVDHVRQRNQHQNQQRYEREQSVIRHCAGKQQALIGAKALEHRAQECRGVAGDDGGAAPQPEPATHGFGPGSHPLASPSARLRSASSTRRSRSFCSGSGARSTADGW